jgi:aspartate/methionine/tyrosine aminotransferase
MELFREPARLEAHRGWYREARGALLGAAERWGVELVEPEGAFYALARLPEALAADSVAAAERLLDEQRVVTVPGRAFGESGEGWLRLSWAGPPETVEEGLRRIGLFFRG